ncbi:MAG: 23S rRNA (guanine(2445)-N(2))/(guanine(2069)-N(7))-methyltransferase, partial [Gammaproteobacteria bacterium]|nr:23S rRNA (guanine(2445)-N(2))/(guanine(2069)-N(7))-methyltransferase [Gammaproteobacteria bacterium]
MDFFATTAKGLEHLLEEELIQLGASSVKMTRAGVYFSGDLHTAYTVCLWSRVANHVLMPLVSFSAEDPETLYTAAQTLHWLSHFEADVTLRIDVVGTHASINNTQFIAQKIKDAIVDQIRAETQTRPTIQLDQPDIALHTFVQGHDFTISLSLSGESLHKRGYRLEGGRAPLKETLAAGILKRAGWEEQAKSEHPCLIDPMCGSGTLLIEAALMAYDIAPLLNRSYFGFLKWKAHDHSIWEALIEEATARRAKKLQAYRADIRGYDNHPKAIATARANIQRAGLSEFISVAVQDVTQISGLSLSHEKGLIVMNPPYGERLQPGEEAELKALFQRIGHHFQKEFLGWELAIFTAVPEWMKSLDIR